MHEGVQRLQEGKTVFVIGKPGSGRTTFALRLLRALGQKFYWITGASGLAHVEFAVLSSLCSQIPQTREAAGHPMRMIAAITGFSSHSPMWILLDRAEQVDEQSAAVLAQLALSGQVHLVVATAQLRQLPICLAQLASMHSSWRLEMAPMNREDARFLTEEVLGGPVNESTVCTLLHVSGGKPLQMRELLYDAQDEQAVRFVGGYWSLHPEWKPNGTRISDLVHARLGAESPPMRELVERLAITGQLPLQRAGEVLGTEVLDRAIDTGLARVLDAEPSPGDSPATPLVDLTAGIPAEAVVGLLGRHRLGQHLQALGSVISNGTQAGGLEINLALLRQRVGCPLPADELLRPVLRAGANYRYDIVVALTEQLGSQQQVVEETRTLLAAARAVAQFETGAANQGLETLSPWLDQHAAPIRQAAAYIHHHGPTPQLALDLLQPRPGDPPDVEAQRLVLLSLQDQPVDSVSLLAAFEDQRIHADLRLACLARYGLLLAYQGQAVRARELFTQVFASPVWAHTGACGRRTMFSALHPVLLAEGNGSQQLRSRITRIQDDSSSAHHLDQLIWKGAWNLETGNAQVAAVALDQALSLAELNDPLNAASIVWALRSRAASLLGNTEQARHFLQQARAARFDGQPLRLEAERALLAAVLRSEGTAAARDYLSRLLTQAEERGLKMQQVRLLHDAWRLRLTEQTEQFSSLAATVEGTLATTLAGYGTALENLGPQLDELIDNHVRQGRLLYAAELANHGSELARASGKRARASHLLSRCAEIAGPLANVNSPRLGRARVDSALLSEREYAACVRAAQGESNTQIAAALYLSPRTVEGHLQRAYAKLGIRDRRQLIDHDDSDPDGFHHGAAQPAQPNRASQAVTSYWDSAT